MRQRAFTLIELLVVVMVIAVLSMLLLPGIATVRDSVRSMVCLSHLREVGFAYAGYAEDNRGLIPPVKTWKGEWGTDLLPYIDDDSKVAYTDKDNSVGAKIIRGCPAYKFKPTPWQFGYAMNNFLLLPASNDNNSAKADGTSYFVGNVVTLTWSRITERSNRLLVADTNNDENLWGHSDVHYRHHRRGGALMCDFRTVSLLSAQANWAINDPAKGDY